jgi:DNA-binding MarR family transcriptional regulator
MNNQTENNRKVLHQLHNLARAIDNAGDQLLRSDLGLGFSQFKIMSLLKEYPYSSQKTIARSLNLTPPAVSRHVESLLAKGLIATRVNPSNKREHFLSLTQRGKETLIKIQALFDVTFADVVQILTPPEQKLLVTMLDKLYAEISLKK